MGDVTAPAEIFPRLAALEAMSETLTAAGHLDAAHGTLEYLAEARNFAALTEMRLARLRGVWEAVELAEGFGTLPAERQARIAAAMEAYRDRRVDA